MVQSSRLCIHEWKGVGCFFWFSAKTHMLEIHGNANQSQTPDCVCVLKGHPGRCTSCPQSEFITPSWPLPLQWVAPPTASLSLTSNCLLLVLSQLGSLRLRFVSPCLTKMTTSLFCLFLLNPGAWNDAPEEKKKKKKQPNISNVPLRNQQSSRLD